MKKKKLFNLVLGTAQLDKNYSLSKKNLNQVFVPYFFIVNKR